MRPAGSTPRSGASCASKTSSPSSPFSSAMRSSRKSGFAAKLSRSFCGSTPARTQESWKDANRFVVSTPPQSTSRPLRCPLADSSPLSTSISHLLGLSRELEHAVAERLQVRVVRSAGERALVVALHEHDRLPQRERRVPAQIAHRAPRPLLVSVDQPRPRRKALAPRDPAERLAHPAFGIAGLGPHHAQIAEIRERVADRRHLPVEHREQTRARSGGEDRVAEPEVAVP